MYGINYAWRNFGGDFGGIDAWGFPGVSGDAAGYVRACDQVRIAGRTLPFNDETKRAFEKIGPGCCALDLASGRVTRGVAPTEDRWFYGHGAFSPDGARLASGADHPPATAFGPQAHPPR